LTVELLCGQCAEGVSETYDDDGRARVRGRACGKSVEEPRRPTTTVRHTRPRATMQQDRGRASKIDDGSARASEGEHAARLEGASGTYDDCKAHASEGEHATRAWKSLEDLLRP